MRTAAIALLPLLFAGCSSQSSLLYEGDPPRLVDATVTLRTRWTHREDETPDIRRVKCRDGVLTAELVSRTQGHRVGPVPVARWEELWRTLLETRPFAGDPRFDVEPNDPGAPGPYHVVSLELGRRFHEFSAQQRRNVLGVFKTAEVTERLRYSDAVAEVVSTFATQRLGSEPGEGDTGSGTPRTGTRPAGRERRE